MSEVYYKTKDGKFTWTDCPVCNKLMVIANTDNYSLTPEDGKQICDLTWAIFYPKKYDISEKGCLKDGWSMHLTPHDKEENHCEK